MASADTTARADALVAELFAPAPLVLSLLVLAGWSAAGWTGAAWGLGTAVLVASLPMLVLRVLARRGCPSTPPRACSPPSWRRPGCGWGPRPWCR